ncbi:nucleoside transporter C-terminal domain-containing protein [Microcoleus sp. CAWBG58]|uniref:NupC/NupG family nucleoside CNT transporter n=1 Tax=Microcoleus sp. CAWBG58 TaxID=2841651 RepID=UPI0025DD4AA0|nr:nucleoside transporter C-terminal domain-containing protein [Microcoleus sp. CAWBG58]
MSIYNFISFLGIFGLCGIAWIFSENRQVRYIPWRVIIWGIGLQLVLGFLVFLFPPTRIALEWFTSLLDGVFTAADAGARFVFGRNIVPIPGQDPPVNLGYIFAFRALPTVVFFSGLMALLENIGVIQIITNFFAKIFYLTMRLSGAEALSGAANIFVGIEAAIVVKPYLAKMTRSELCAILSCCFGTAASSTLAIYVSVLKPVFPNILGHLVSASIIAIPACFVLSKILVPETEIPLTMGGIPKEKPKPQGRELVGEEVDINDGDLPKQETVGGEPIERVSPLDAAIIGALDGVKMAVSIAAVLILILGLVSLINQILGAETLRKGSGILFYPLTLLTGVPLKDSWIASEIIGQRLYLTAIPPYGMLAELAGKGLVSSRTVLIVSYALSGFAHLASVGIFVGGTIALIPSRRKDISELGWKALFVGTLATMMIACIAGLFDTGDSSILGTQTPPAAPISAPASPKSESSPAASPKPSVAPTIANPKPSPKGEKVAPKAQESPKSESKKTP